MDKPSTSSTNSPKPNKTAPKSQLIVLSPDVLKKLGIASQISKLTKTSITRTSATTTTTTTTVTTDHSININTAKKLDKISLENQIKKQLSQTTLSNAIKLKLSKSFEENTVKKLTTTNDDDDTNSHLKFDKEIPEINLNQTNQINPTDANLLLNSPITSSAKNNNIAKNLNESESVLNETAIRKSGRKRKISSILENYVTELSESTEKYVKTPENKQKLTSTNLKNEKSIDSPKQPTNESPEDCKISSAEEAESVEKPVISKLNHNIIITSTNETQNKTSTFEESKNFENNQLQNDEITAESVTCLANENQSIKNAAENVVEQLSKTNDENNKSKSPETKEIANNISSPNKVESFEHPIATSPENEQTQVCPETKKLPNITENESNTKKQLPDADNHSKTIDAIDATKFNVDFKVLDPKVAELLKPLKRGRPKGKKNRASGQFIATTNETAAIAEEEQTEITATEEESSPARRRSGRARKEKKLKDAVYYDSPSTSTPPSRSELEETPGKKKRGRPRKHQIPEEYVTSPRPSSPTKPSNNSEDDEEETITIKSRRKKKINIIESDDDFEETDNSEEQEFAKQRNKRGQKLKPKSKIVECGVCNEKIPNTLWAHHCGKHNYLCWRVGEEPIDLQNRKVCESILLKVALTKKVMFTCSKCGEKRKSAVGYLSHIDFCQKTEEERLAMRVMCPECNKLLQPCSLKIHMRNHLHESSKVAVAEVDSNVDLNDGGNSVGRVKRNAAKKAQGLINKFTNDDAEDEPVEKEIKRLYKKGSDQKKKFRQRKYWRTFDEQWKRSDGSMACPINKCPYIGFDVKELKEHIESCSQLGTNDFICFVCWFISQDEHHIEKHILQNHLDIVDSADQEFMSGSGSAVPSSDNQTDVEDEQESDQEEEEEEDDDDDDDELLMDEEETIRRKKKSSINRAANSEHGSRSCVDKIKFLANEVRVSASRNCTYPPAGKWTNQFYQHNYSTKNLFTDFCVSTKNWIQIPSAESDKYLPPTRKSIGVKTVLASKTLPDLQGEEHDWKEFELFETELNDDTWTIFCGGPVWEMAWLPTPINSVVDQILAVSIQRDFNETFKTSESYASNSIIQFWNFGKLHFKYPLANAPKATLEFCLVHNHGNVWCMEWCPSGCYDDDDDDANTDCSLRRMGLLALACSDGNIPIYSIPFPQINNNDEHKLFKPIASCRLIMQDDVEMKLGNWNYQCTKLNWSKIKGHNKIVAGYSNGMVCLWDLDMNPSPLLKSVDENDTILLKPYFSFQPHTAAITALHFYYPLTGNNIRWLFTGSWDRNCCVWDLEEPSTPVFMFAKRGNVSDGTMINHWLCSFISFDDVHFIEHTTTSIQNVRDFGFKNSSLMSANSMVMGLSASDWANAVAQVTLAGELCCTFQRQLLLGYDIDKGSRCKRFLVSYCETIDKHLSPKERKEKLQIKNQSIAAIADTYNTTDTATNTPEMYDNNFFRYVMSKENDQYDAYDEPETYEQVCNKYGIIFCDIPMDDYDKIPPETLKIVKTSCKMKDAPTEMYPILAQNRVRWNPNKQAYIYISSGSHSGFVRLRCVRFMHSKMLTLIK